jgi:ATP adenylyltransferase
MQHIWTPWRYKYISSVQNHSACIFCLAKESSNMKDCFVLFKGNHNLVLLNIYPYTSGHIMIAPLCHIASPVESDQEQLQEMIFLMQQSILSLKEVYKPGGFNVG